MKIIKFIQNKIFSKKQFILPNEFKTEDEYYTFFFTKHPKWSKPEPNKAEKARLQKIEDFINEIIKEKQNNNTVLEIIDFGSGRGWLTNILSKYGNALGIEPVDEVVKYAKKIFPHIHFETGSIEKLENKKADLIVCSEVIEHIQKTKQPKYFKRFFESLNTNGFCIITTPRAEVQAEWQLHRADDGQPVEEWITENQLENLATAVGFEVVDKKILQEYANGENTTLLDLYQIWLFKKK